MSHEKTSQRKPTSNGFKKLRAVSIVCGLASSWQQWVSENEEKQANEPGGWDPIILGGSTVEPSAEPRKTWVAKKPGSIQERLSPEMCFTAATPGSPENTEARPSEERMPQTRIKTKQVVKTVSSGVQEKSVGVGLLTEKMRKETLPSGEEIDKMLKKKSSPTRRRKCTNMVSSLTKSWKQMEGEQRFGKEGEGAGESHCGEVEKDGRNVETGLIPEDPQRQRRTILKVEDLNNSEVEPVRIKRPQVSMYKNEAEDANKLSTLSKHHSAVGNLKSRWQNWAVEHTVSQKLNPFSEYFDYDYSMSLRLQKGQEGYGRPKEGTKTAERAKRAERHIHREIDDMCYVIRTMADPDPDGKTRVTFGELFDRYVRISDKVVGILMRARKHRKVAFEGEMLWQGQDDGVTITLLV